jgi:hypothetical protein
MAWTLVNVVGLYTGRGLNLGGLIFGGLQYIKHANNVKIRQEQSSNL